MTPPYGVRTAPAGDADVLGILGITGDLSRGMTLHSLYRLERRGLLDCRIVGVASDHWSADDIRKYLAESIDARGEPIESEIFDRLAARLTYLPGDLTDPDTYRQLARATAGSRLPVWYLQLPPALYPRVVRELHEAGLTRSARVLLEKPFGRDLPSAISLADELHHYIDEAQIYRVDHFLGKVGFDELLHLRFGNTIFEPVWNRHHVESVQITLAEDFGVADRGHFYDETGALRDACATHLLELLAAGTMEPPAGSESSAIKDQQVALWEAMPPAEPANYVRGQYDGYRSHDGVARDSTTETFAAMRLDIDNWRWSGVPFLLRAGKMLATLHTEFRVIFQRPPRLAVAGPDVPGLRHHSDEPDQVVLRLDPSAGLRLQLSSRGSTAPLLLDRELGHEGVTAPAPYEVLLYAALHGDQTRFGRQDGVQQRWRVMQPLLDSPPAVQPYRPGTWGPAGADALPGQHRPWQPPWV